MTDRRNEFSQIQEQLWLVAALIHPTYKRRKYDGWVMCPRQHAVAHLRCIVERIAGPDPARDIFAEFDRFHPGEDVVFAVGDVQ